MLALQDRPVRRRGRTRTEGQAPGWAAPGPGAALHCREGDDNGPLAALAGEALGARFRSWRGVTGRRYVFSVYAPRDCPAYDHAVVIVAATDDAGDRTALLIADTGCFPEIVLARAAAQWSGAGAGVEFHVHLLAPSPAARRAVIADLSHAPRS